MDGFYSDYVMDTPVNGAASLYPQELFVYSPTRELGESVGVRRCGPEGCGVYAPNGVTPEGVPIAQKVCIDEKRDNDYPFETRFFPFRQGARAPNVYAAIDQQAERRPMTVELEVANDGEHATLSYYHGAKPEPDRQPFQIQKFHRVGPELNAA